MDMGGNVGTQSSTIIVRGIATDNIDTNKNIREVLSEKYCWAFVRCSKWNCGCFGCLCMAGNTYVGPCCGGLSMTLTLTVAAALGAFVPLALNEIGKDPADSSGPLVTTVLDVVGLLIYFGSASLFVGHLL